MKKQLMFSCMFSSLCSCPVSWRLTSFLPDCSLWAGCALSYVTELLLWPVHLSHCVSWSYRKAAIAFPLPAGSWTLRTWGWEKNTSSKGWKISFRGNTNYLNVCRPKWSTSFKISWWDCYDDELFKICISTVLHMNNNTLCIQVCDL